MRETIRVVILKNYDQAIIFKPKQSVNNNTPFHIVKIGTSTTKKNVTFWHSDGLFSYFY